MPYSYSDLEQDLHEAKQQLLKQREEDKVAPKIKYYSKNDYLDSVKFKNLNNFRDDRVALIPSGLYSYSNHSEGDSSCGLDSGTPSKVTSLNSATMKFKKFQDI